MEQVDCIIFYAYSDRGMEFEYDPEKSSTNARKHGIDFEIAQQL